MPPTKKKTIIYTERVIWTYHMKLFVDFLKYKAICYNLKA
jgi:hypothetical protein